MLTVRTLGDIRSQDAGSLGSEQNAGISRHVDIGQVRLVGGVYDSVKVASLKISRLWEAVSSALSSHCS